MSVEKHGWTFQKSLFAETNQDSSFFHTRENSKMFNHKPSASWVTDITRDFLTCYSCSYCSSMLTRKRIYLDNTLIMGNYIASTIAVHKHYLGRLHKFINGEIPYLALHQTKPSIYISQNILAYPENLNGTKIPVIPSLLIDAKFVLTFVRKS